ncbi:hypothetical protein, partial [Pseudomonas asiatica]|uniref:hypothetical protein n=1 Tax=Pseudomonas asiatica TaxID=2219225 RepID=UPI0019D62A12
SKIEQVQWNTWVSFQSAQWAKLGQFSVSGNTLSPLGCAIGRVAAVDGMPGAIAADIPPADW